MSKPINEVNPETVENYIHILPQHQGIFLELGLHFYEGGNYTKAIRNFREAEKLSSIESQIYLKLAISYYWINDYKGTNKYFEKYSKLEKLSEDHYSWWGFALQELKEFEKALEKHLKAYEMNPNSVWDIGHIGYNYQELKQPEKALEYYEIALNIDNRDEMALLNLGWIYLANYKDVEKSREYSEACIKLYPYSSHALMNLAHYHLIMQDFEQAMEYYKRSKSSLGGNENFNKLFWDDYEDLKSYPVLLETAKDVLKKLEN